jgi:hypothetical protein
MKVAIFDAFNGAGGDMIIASLLQVTLNEEELMEVPRILGIDLKPRVSEVRKRGISASQIEVGEGGKERTFGEVVEIISSSKLNDRVKKDTISIFEILAKAEGKIHGRDYREAVFHEVGSDDAIFDIAAAAIGIGRLKEKGYKIFTTPIRLGGGFVEFSHGRYPAPAPATLEILTRSKIEAVYDGEGELLTPTAAAIFAYYSEGSFKQPFIIERVSYGAGKRESEVPNVLRLILGRATVRDPVTVE